MKQKPLSDGITASHIAKKASATRRTIYCALSLGIILWCGLPTGMVAQTNSSTVQSVDNRDIIAALTEADVVYLGENHDSIEDHRAQLEIIAKLYRQNSNLAIALEMFQRPFQPILDRYLAGEIDEAQLRRQTEYDKRWGFDWEYYAPILRFAKAHNLPLLAINTPTEITRKVAENGLESLTEADLRYIPPVSEIDTDNQDYRAASRKIYQAHNHYGHGNSDGFDNFFAAQVLWDETMAAAISQYYRDNPQTQIVVLAGEGHVVYDYGIPDRVARRIDDASFRQTSVRLGAIDDSSLAGEGKPTDFIWNF
ncbi:ChaN family lipoprotein [Myxosarcina sp. GI1(2024)]